MVVARHGKALVIRLPEYERQLVEAEARLIGMPVLDVVRAAIIAYCRPGSARTTAGSPVTMTFRSLPPSCYTIDL
jgi:hypothetical protein